METGPPNTAALNAAAPNTGVPEGDLPQDGAGRLVRLADVRAPGDHWTELVELYEYKVRDLQEGRRPRGGRRSLGDLRDLLTGAPLDSALLRRFGRADREWRALLRTQVGRGTERTAPSSPAPLSPALLSPALLSAAPVSPSPESLPRPSPATVTTATDLRSLSPWLGLQGVGLHAAEQDPEALALSGLRAALWLIRARARAREVAAEYLREQGLVLLRVAYTLHVALERGEHHMTVPAEGDPLTSLANPAVAQTLMADLVGQLAQLARADLLAGQPPTPAVRALRAALSDISSNPYPRQPDQGVLEARVRAAEREGLGPELIGALARTLRADTGTDRPGEERAQIRGAAARLLTLLSGLLPGADLPGDTSDHPAATLPPLPERVLYARSPARRLPQPDDGARTLCLRLSGGESTEWRGLTLRWRRSGEGWLLSLHTREYRLSADAADQPDGVTVQLGTQPGWALLYGDYLLLLLDGGGGARRERLLHLLRLARAAALLLDPAGAYLTLRLARAAAALLRGDPLDTQTVDVLSAERYAAVSPQALLEFARRGASDLLLSLQSHGAGQVETLFARAAQLVDAPPASAQALLHALRVAAGLAADDAEPPVDTASGQLPVLSRPGEVLALTMQPGPLTEPLTVRLLGRALTLRPDYKGELAAVLPGMPAALVSDLLVLPLSGGSPLLVRQEDDLLVGFQPSVDHTL